MGIVRAKFFPISLTVEAVVVKENAEELTTRAYRDLQKSEQQSLANIFYIPMYDDVRTNPPQFITVTGVRYRVYEFEIYAADGDEHGRVGVMCNLA